MLCKAGLGDKYKGPSITAKLRRHKNRCLSDDEILDELKKLACLLQTNTLTRNDIRNHSELLADTIVVNRFGSFKRGLNSQGSRLQQTTGKELMISGILRIFSLSGFSTAGSLPQMR